MSKELIDHVWKHCLPKEFKEEVKKYYDNSPALGAKAVLLLENMFGIHNLTSDAEGEEMLTVPRSAVIAEMDKLHKYSFQMPDLQLGLNALTALFGSKCLPDEPASNEPKPAEPKFKVGDKVFYVSSPTIKHKCTVTKVTQNEHSGKWEYNVLYNWGKPGMWIPESDLEPYAEPQPNCTIKSDSCQPVTDRHHFEESRNYNRMHIAAMAMQGLLANGDMRDYTKVAKDALAHADVLIKESKKGYEQ